MTWVLLLWCALILIWAIAGAGSASDDCTPGYQDACDAGTAIGVALILLIGFFGFVFLALIWFMTRPRTRPCPRCGEDVKKGHTVCRACGFDFATIGQGEAAAAGPG
jgi:hypothetical protein